MLLLLTKAGGTKDESSGLSFFTCGSGSVAILFAVLSVAVTVCFGAAIDFSRWLNARQQTMAAIETAVLAAARELQLNPQNVSGALATADSFYRENVKERLSLTSDTVTFRTEANNTAVTAMGAVFLSTTALRLAGINELSLLSLTGSEFAHAVLSMGPRAGTHVEAALVLDISSSMTAAKMDDLKHSVTNFVEMAIWPDQANFTSRISVVPFTGDVRIPAGMIARVRDPALPGSIAMPVPCGHRAAPGQVCTLTYRQTPCMAERQGIEKYSDAEPGLYNFVMPAYSTSGSCSTASGSEIVPLTNDKTLIRSRIAGLIAGNGAAAHSGLAWGWYTLSPAWNDIWPVPSSSATPYGSSAHVKVAVLIADGDFTTEYDPNGLRTTALGAGLAANGTSNAQTTALCEAMKSAGIAIYAVAYGIEDGTSIDVLQGCASAPAMYYRAQDGSQLMQALTDVAIRLSSLHLSQ